MAQGSRRVLSINVAPGVVLQAIRREPPGGQPSKNVALLLHPHPKLGGDANNNVVVGVAKALADQEWSTVAINTRGVGGSTGSSTWTGTDEREDLRAAYAMVEQEGAENIVVIGYSYGACVASSTVEDLPRVAAVALVSYPSGMAANVLLSHHFPRAKAITKPLLWITGTGDQFHSVAQSKAKFEQLTSSSKEFRVCEGVDHFWFGAESEVAAAVTDWLQRTLPSAAPS